MCTGTEKKLCRDFLTENFNCDNTRYFELWVNYGKDNYPNHTYYVWNAPYVTRHNETTFICVGDTYDEAEEKALNHLRNCKTVKNIDLEFGLCEVEKYKGRVIIYN